MSAESVSRALSSEALAPPIASALGLSCADVTAALQLLAEGAHPPFVARYRRERTSGLNLLQVEEVQARAARAAELEFRREALRRELRERGGLTEALDRAIAEAPHGVALDDVRQVLRRRKRGAAAKARAGGLQALAEALWAHGSTGARARPDAAADVEPASLVEAGTDAAEALAGASAICGEDLLADPELRHRLRTLVRQRGFVRSAVVADKKDKAGRYSRFFAARSACDAIPPLHVLALGRGEREGLLEIEIEVDEELALAEIDQACGIDPTRPCGAVLHAVATNAWRGALGKAVRIGVRTLLKQRADAEGIARFRENLRPSLMAPPFGPRPVLAIDPGFQHGCRVAVIDGEGKLVADDTLFPLQPRLQVPQSRERIAELVLKHEVEAIVIGNGGGGREVERMCRELCADGEAMAGRTVLTAIVELDAAALFASSKAGKDELPEAEPALRRAVALGRRLQDPLAELAKVDLRRLGLGQYQNEVYQEALRDALEQVLESCVNEVGVDVNRASVALLSRIAGLGQALSKAIVSHREAHGPYRSRAQLLEVPGLPGKAFEQASGFLIVEGGEQPLDRTAIHPERYGQVIEMARDLGVTVADLLGNEELLAKIVADNYLGKPGIHGEPLGRPSFDFVLDQLAHPGRGRRPEFSLADFRPAIAEFKDLEVGMEVEGLVTHITDFGAFVDVGLHQEGLVHVSQLSHAFVSNPADAVHVGQKVKAKVLEVDPDRKRFALSIKALLPAAPRREGPPRREDRGPGKGEGRRGRGGGGSPRDESRGQGRGEGQGRGDEGGGKPHKKRHKPGREHRDDRPRPSERTLGFRMDLSAIAARLGKGS